jgi:hypothetical protein
MHFSRSVDIGAEMASARIKLDPQTIEAIARRVVELLDRRSLSSGPELVNAAELARRLGTERSWVYTHAIELGAVKLGSGRKPRLRFDPQVAARALHKTGEGPASEGRRAGAAASDRGWQGEFTSGVISSERGEDEREDQGSGA